MSSLASRRSRPLRGRTYSGERRGVLSAFFVERDFNSSQHLLLKATRAPHPNRHCSALPRSHRLTTVTDPNNNPVERYAYDNTGKLTTRTDAVNQASSYSYDGRGRITGMLDRKGQTGTIEYDIAGRVARTVLADATMDYTYDAAGRMTQLTETPTGANSGTSGGIKRVTLTYDILDRVTQEKHEAGGISTVTDHQYDALDRRTRRSVSASGVGAGTVGAVNFGPDITDYSYDDADRLTAITYRGNGSAANGTGTLNQTTTYQYDNANRLITKTFPDLANPNGTSSSAGNPVNRIAPMGRFSADLQLVTNRPASAKCRSTP